MLTKESFIHDHIFYGSISKVRNTKVDYNYIKNYLESSPLTCNEISNPPDHPRYNPVNEYSTAIYEYLVSSELIDPLWNILLLHSSIYNLMTYTYFPRIDNDSVDSLNMLKDFAKIYKNNYLIIPHIIQCQLKYKRHYDIINLKDERICLFIDDIIDAFNVEYVYFMPLEDLIYNIRDDSTYTYNSLCAFINAKKQYMYKKQKDTCALIKEDVIARAWHPDRIHYWLMQGFHQSLFHTF
jgi:hypothetical protein